jgi:hypothetical protein
MNLMKRIETDGETGGETCPERNEMKNAWTERIEQLETEKKELIKEIKNQISKCTEKMKTELDTNFIDGAIVGYEHVLRMIREGGETE